MYAIIDGADNELTALLPPKFELEYKWKATRPDDLPLGVRTMFILVSIIFIGLYAVIYVVYDRDAPKGRKPVVVDSKKQYATTTSSSSNSGIYVNKRRGSKD
jgi:hypothetical protein